MVMGFPSVDHIWARGYPLANGQGILPPSKEREYCFFIMSKYLHWYGGLSVHLTYFHNLIERSSKWNNKCSINLNWASEHLCQFLCFIIIIIKKNLYPEILQSMTYSPPNGIMSSLMSHFIKIYKTTNLGVQ